MANFLHRRALLAASLLSALMACDHVAPGAPSAGGGNGPFSPSTPLRLTLNPGADMWPTWTPDGSGIWYAYQALDRPDMDVCLGRIPADGGTRTVEACQVSPTAADDSLDVTSSPALRGPWIAWMRVTAPRDTNRPPRINYPPAGGDLVVAPLTDQNSPISLRHFPFTSSAGTIQSLGRDVQWIDDTTLTYAAYRASLLNRGADTLVFSEEIVLVGLGGSLRIVPATAGASSVGVGLLPGELYFTRDGDSRIFRLRLPDTAVTTVYDFGGLGIARDVRVSVNGILAVVGGAVFDSLGAGQIDHGGPVYLLRDSAVTPLTPPPALPFWRHPSFAPNGRSFAGSAHDSSGFADDIYRVDLQ